jgi:hypothetical protein
MSTLSELTYAQFKPDAGTIRMLPDHDTNATMFWVSRLDPEPTEPCKLHLSKSRTSQMVNALKLRPVYPWKRNQHLSHKRKVSALRAWRGIKPEYVMLSLPSAFGKAVARIIKG